MTGKPSEMKRGSEVQIACRYLRQIKNVNLAAVCKLLSAVSYILL
jgi:hypothetical protein